MHLTLTVTWSDQNSLIFKWNSQQNKRALRRERFEIRMKREARASNAQLESRQIDPLTVGTYKYLWTTYALICSFDYVMLTITKCQITWKNNNTENAYVSWHHMETHETFYGNKFMIFLFEKEFMGFSGISFDDFSIFWK